MSKITVSTKMYSRIHGSAPKPKQEGHWIFRIGDMGKEINHIGTYTDGRSLAKHVASLEYADYIALMP
jgi:hypothetical protein